MTIIRGDFFSRVKYIPMNHSIPRPLSVYHSLRSGTTSPKYDILTLAVIKSFPVVFGGDVSAVGGTEGAKSDATELTILYPFIRFAKQSVENKGGHHAP